MALVVFAEQRLALFDHSAIREPAHTIEGMLAKARVAMRHSLTWYTQIGETLPATPEEGYADIAGDEFDPDAAVVSLWADLERLAARGQS